MTKTTLTIFLVMMVVGVVLYFLSDKKRNMATGEWTAMLQWSFMGFLVGAFGALCYVMSFTAVLLLFSLLTGVSYFLDKFLKSKARKKRKDPMSATPAIIEYMGDFFFLIFIIFVVRTFIFEPFLIPSSSMRPGLVVGDFVLVNKYIYGIRVPITNKVLIPVNRVQRGDVVVFHSPPNPKVDYIKRIVALPGDKIEYREKRLYINDEPIEDLNERDNQFHADRANGNKVIKVKEYEEVIGDKKFGIFKIPAEPTLDVRNVTNPQAKEYCDYRDNTGFSCKIPEGMYFAMGDNRDYSDDSRYWGFVPENNILGKAVLIWMNAGNIKRTGTLIK